MERKPKWALEIAPWSPSLWEMQYHEDPLDHLLDPRRHDSTKISEPEPVSSVTKPRNDGLTAGKVSEKSSLTRMRYDEKLYQLAFGRVMRRSPSPDNTHLDADGCDAPSLPYRTHPYDQRTTYKPRKPTEQLFFERLNATQFKVYSSQSALDSKDSEWLRVGSLFHDHIEAVHRQKQGDVSSTDQHGLSYQLEKRILENKAGLEADRWTRKQIRQGRYYVQSLLEAMVPDSDHFRADLFMYVDYIVIIYNDKNHNNLQSVGMDCLTTVFEFQDTTGKTRRSKPCQVLMELSRFDNLCPRYSDRQLLRLMLGRGDDLSSSSYLLSPLDAARLSQSMLVLPRQERDLFVFKATLSGSPIGTFMVSSQNSSQSVYTDEVLFPTLSSAQTTFSPDAPVSSLAERKNQQNAQKTSRAAASTYRSACANFPDRKGFSTDYNITDSPVLPTAPEPEQARAEPSNNADPATPLSVTPLNEAVTSEAQRSPGRTGTPSSSLGANSTPELSTSPFDRLQEAFDRIVDPIPPISLEEFPSWLYIFSSASATEDPNHDLGLEISVKPDAVALPTANSNGRPFLELPPAVHTCDPDPRTSFPPHYVHPPMALGVHLYDDYDSLNEDSDDDVLRVFTPPPRFDTPTPDDSPRCFSGLQTPDPANSPQGHDTDVFQYPAIQDALVPEIPYSTSTPTKNAVNSVNVASYSQGPPGHRVPEIEDFSLDNPSPVHTCETSNEHSSNLFYMFASRIIYRGTRKELFLLCMSYPDAALYMHHARCLRGLTPAQKQRVIGPFTESQKAAFRERFHPTRLKYTRRLEIFDRLYSIEVPDTSPDFKDFLPPHTPPAFKYMAEKRLRELLFNRRYSDPNQPRFGRSTAEYVTESITESSEEIGDSDVDSDCAVFEDESTTESLLFDTDDYLLKAAPYSNGDTATGHFLGEIWGPYFTGSVLHDIPVDLTFDEFLDELDEQVKHGPIQVDPALAGISLEDPSAEAALTWVRQKMGTSESLLPFAENNADLTGPDTSSSDEYSTTEEALTDSEDEEDIGLPSDADLGPIFKDYHFKDQDRVQKSLDRAGKEHSISKTAQFSVPSICVLVPYGFHQSDSKKKGQVVMDYSRSVSIHPVRKELFLIDYDLAPDTHLMLQSREYNLAHKDAASAATSYPTEIGTLAQFVQVDPKTGISFFPVGTMNKFIRQFLGPRPVSLGYQQFVLAAKVDSRTASYPGVLNVLRGNVNVSFLPMTKLASYAFMRKDRRFKDKTEDIVRPQLFYYSIKMLEPTHFCSTSRRHWVILLSDVDVHSWTPVSSFALLCGKMEVLLKNQSMAPEDAVMDKVGVPHYQPSRPGMPDSFVLSASIGSLRPSDERDPRRNSLFTRWLMRHNGRILVTLFAGAVQRISPSQAKLSGVTSATYDAAIADQRDVSKFYRTKISPDGRVVRVRRTDVFPKTLIGTYRPVFGKAKGNSEPELLFYEKILWPGINFDHRVINVDHPNYVPTMHGGRFNVSRGGPRVILLNANPMEKELIDSFIALPAFILDNWDHICARARHDHPGSRALLRKVSLLPVDFSVEMLPPLWFQQFQKLRNYFGKEFYLGLERLLIAMEMDEDLHPPFVENVKNSQKLDQLQPYSFPHLEAHRESFVRVTSSGVASYRSEESEVLRRMPDVLSQMTGHSVPQSGCCYGRYYANSTRLDRSESMSDTKPHSTLEFSTRSDYF
ncbi:unnamed protein product [Oikopleura dioica]|uniref:Uncharacterized protein n=1 Tax=Oikopleura dioica TaxID=34765 RepID=E4XXA3_OIKDI|nr:unnamed protein product [Oikopleura dioica]